METDPLITISCGTCGKVMDGTWHECVGEVTLPDGTVVNAPMTFRFGEEKP